MITAGNTRPQDSWFHSVAVLLVLTFLAFVPTAQLIAGEGGSNVPNPGAELWREVRQRDTPMQGSTQAEGVEAGVLINADGQWWRRVRMQQLIPYGAAFLGINLTLIILWYLIRGRIPIQGGRSGRLVERFTLAQRMAHWFLVALVLLLALTGLVLLFGRFVLVPLVGTEAFGVIASAAKEAHNLFGPIFPLAVVALFFRFARGNVFNFTDLKWLFKGGGMLGIHAGAGRYNGGEKLWFWAVIWLGLALTVSGFILDFAIFGQGRLWMEWSLVVHGVAAILLIAGFLGHLYIATIGMEGAIESMTDGRVDANWAKEHHDLWYEELEESSLGRAQRNPGNEQG